MMIFFKLADLNIACFVRIQDKPYWLYTSIGNSLFAFECFVYLRNNTCFFFHYHVNFCSFGRYLAQLFPLQLHLYTY
jgi:hypothetical protein